MTQAPHESPFICCRAELAVLEIMDRSFPCHSGNGIKKRAMNSLKFEISYISVDESLISSGISLIKKENE